MVTYVLLLTLLFLSIFQSNAKPNVNNKGSPCYEANSVKCSNFGNYNCGVCECDDQHEGPRCECLRSSDTPYNSSNCKASESDIAECSGKGVCVCGQCECDVRDNPYQIISGKWCECDNFSCYRHEGLLCGGHGVCECGTCLCEKPWIGDACECYNSTDTCYEPHVLHPQLCSGRGDCVCGRCECNASPAGLYCQRSQFTCSLITPCLFCKIQKDNDTCFEYCKDIKVLESEELGENLEGDKFLCELEYDDDNRCDLTYLYKEIQSKVFLVSFIRKPQC